MTGGVVTAGDADYRVIGGGYARYRRPDPRIAAQITAALAGPSTLVNVGAGAGSYEPNGVAVAAIEPSAAMRAQRPPTRARAIAAVAEQLPFGDRAFDAAMATFTVHQWPDVARGLAELRRVTRGPVVVLTCDPSRLDRFWLNEYAPEVIATEARRYPPVDVLLDGLGGARVDPLAIPLDCVDGFGEAYYGRPEALLDPGARQANSAWSFNGPEVPERFVRDLQADLDDGTWDRRHGQLRTQAEFDGSLVLVVSDAS